MAGLSGTRCRRRIYLMRHGDVCYFDAEGRPVDPRYVELTGDGESHAQAAGKMLVDVPFDRAICSGLRRTEQTAQIVLGSRCLPLHAEPRLNEVKAGRLSAVPAQEGEAVIAYPYDFADAPGARFINGEVWADFRQRVLAAWAAILADESWLNLLLVAHGAVNRVLLAEVAGLGLLGLKAFEQEPACINIIDLDIDAGHIRRGFLRAVNVLPYDLPQTSKHLMVMEHVYREFKAV